MAQLTQLIVQGISAGHRVRGIRIIPHALRPGDEELTPALRLNRGVVARRYADLLETR